MEKALNDVTMLMQNHRSCRRFKQMPVEDHIVNDLLESAQWAPSSHNVQAYSIITVKNHQTKAQLAELCGNQPYVAQCPLFLVFCADFYRLSLTSEMYKKPFEVAEVENLLVGAVDVALAAENLFIAAKSHGLNGVMIGGIRNNPDQVADLLNLPTYVVPIMGMCLGYPDQHVWQKPRLPRRTVVHQEMYCIDQIEGLHEYETISSEYYKKRTNGRRKEGWTQQMAEYLSRPRRPHLKQFIQRQGIELK